MFRYSLYLLWLLIPAGVFAQSAATPADPTVVNYSFSTNKMDQLPFDRPFTFHLTDLPTTNPVFTYVRIKITKLDSKKPVVKNGEIREDDPDNSGLVYVLKDWVRADGQTVTTLDLPEPFPLAPNAMYRVNVELGSTKELTDGEKTALGTKLKDDNKLNATVNALAQKSLSAAASENSSFINTYHDELIGNITQALKSVNPQYSLRKTDFLPLNDIANFRDALANFNNRLHLLGDAAPDPAKLNTVKQDLSATDWYTVDKTGKIQTDLTTLIASFPDGAVPTTLANAKSLSTKLAAIQTTRDKLIDDLISGVILPNVFSYNVLKPSYSTDFVTNSKWYINLDVGYAYVGRIDRGLAYTGANIYFRPIDKTIPLSHYSGWDFWATRTSFLLGLSLGSVEKANVRKGLIGKQALVAGVGFKLNSFLKINGGCFMNYRYDPDPLVTQNTYRFSLSPFVSASIDLDVKTLFTGIGDSIFK